jgi:hypothetical protein
MTNQSPPTQPIHFVNNFRDLVTTPFQGNVNVLCWKRQLIGDFSEIVNQITLNENITELYPDELHELKLSELGQLARKTLLQDWKDLEAHGASPSLNVIHSYERDDSYPFFPTDVYSFHVDRSPIPVDTYLCTYYGDSSEVLPNAQAEQKVLVPEIRAELKKLFGGTEKDFESFLNEQFFDLHYKPKPNAQPIRLGIGHLCRLATDHPNSKVPPCIHRAPKEKNGRKRLLLIC